MTHFALITSPSPLASRRLFCHLIHLSHGNYAFHLVAYPPLTRHWTDTDRGLHRSQICSRIAPRHYSVPEQTRTASLSAVFVGSPSSPDLGRECTDLRPSKRPCKLLADRCHNCLSATPVNHGSVDRHTLYADSACLPRSRHSFFNNIQGLLSSASALRSKDLDSSLKSLAESVIMRSARKKAHHPESCSDMNCPFAS